MICGGSAAAAVALGCLPIDVHVTAVGADTFERHGLGQDGGGDGGADVARGARLDGPGIASVDVDGDGAGSGIVDIEIDVFSVDLLALIGADEIAAGVVALAQETGLVSAVAGEEGRIVPAGQGEDAAVAFGPDPERQVRVGGEKLAAVSLGGGAENDIAAGVGDHGHEGAAAALPLKVAGLSGLFDGKVHGDLIVHEQVHVAPLVVGPVFDPADAQVVRVVKPDTQQKYQNKSCDQAGISFFHGSKTLSF